MSGVTLCRQLLMGPFQASVFLGQGTGTERDRVCLCTLVRCNIAPNLRLPGDMLASDGCICDACLLMCQVQPLCWAPGHPDAGDSQAAQPLPH